MAKEETLVIVEQEIAEGKLGVARDRLQGLINAYPTDLQLRSRLGDVYWKLGYPRLAGRYWFLDDPSTDEKRDAVSQFIQECGQDPSVILRRLKLRFHPDDLTDASAKERIQAQIDECLKRNLALPELKRYVRPVQKTSSSDAWWSFGCMVLLILCLFFMVLGAATAWNWLQEYGLKK